jgi:hypothetical protein
MESYDRIGCGVARRVCCRLRGTDTSSASTVGERWTGVLALHRDRWLPRMTHLVVPLAAGEDYAWYHPGEMADAGILTGISSLQGSHMQRVVPTLRIASRLLASLAALTERRNYAETGAWQWREGLSSTAGTPSPGSLFMTWFRESADKPLRCETMRFNPMITPLAQ